MGTADDRIERVRRSAIEVFARQGFAATSMADLAEAAGMSRPALYQYFRNRADVFRAALGAVLDDATAAALAALDDEQGSDLTDRLDRYLQRAFGDTYQSLASTANGTEIVDAKHELAADIAEAAVARRRQGLERFLGHDRELARRELTEVVDLIELSAIGLKADQPSPRVFRRRLSSLARSVAALVDVAQVDAAQADVVDGPDLTT